MSAESIFSLANPLDLATWNDTFYGLYLDDLISSDDCDFWTASPARWDVSRNFYAP